LTYLLKKFEKHELNFYFTKNYKDTLQQKKYNTSSLTMLPLFFSKRTKTKSNENLQTNKAAFAPKQQKQKRTSLE